MATQFQDLLPAVAALADPTQHVSLGKVGELVALSPSRAQRVFTAELGQSPNAFDRRVRLEVASVLLRACDDRIIDVAMASGFGSHEHFTRAFGAHFGCSPTQWRRRHPTLTHDEAARAVSIARCAGLYRRPLTRKRTTMHYDVAIENLDAVPVMYQTRRLDREEIGSALAEVLPAVYGYVIGAGLAPAGHPFVRYVEMSPAFVSIEAGVPLTAAPAEPAPADTKIRTGELAAGPAAVTVHKGPYEDLGDAYAAIERWVESSEASLAGAPWELYLTDPGEVPDPSDWLTKVCWPVTGVS